MNAIIYSCPNHLSSFNQWGPRSYLFVTISPFFLSCQYSHHNVAITHTFGCHRFQPENYLTGRITSPLTHWDRVTHICVGKLTNIGSDNGLSPGRRQAIIWTNAGILFIGLLGTNFSEFLILILTFSFNKMHLKMSSAKWRPFCLGLNVY